MLGVLIDENIHEFLALTVFFKFKFVLFGYLPEVLHFYHKPYYVTMWLASGLLQSSG
jgi:hypothetical protein